MEGQLQQAQSTADARMTALRQKHAGIVEALERKARLEQLIAGGGKYHRVGFLIADARLMQFGLNHK